MNEIIRIYNVKEFEWVIGLTRRSGVKTKMYESISTRHSQLLSTTPYKEFKKVISRFSNTNVQVKNDLKNHSGVQVKTLISIIGHLFLVPLEKVPSLKFEVKVEDFQKLFALLNKDDLARLLGDYRELINRFLTSRSASPNPLGLIQINENYEITGEKTVTIEEWLNNLDFDTTNDKIKKHHNNWEEIIINTEKVIVNSNENQVDVEENNEDNDDLSEILKCVSLIDSFNPKIIPESEEETIVNNNYVSSNKFVFRTPLSLIQKMYPDEWETYEEVVTTKGNRFGIEIENDTDFGFFLVLNPIGVAKIKSLDEIKPNEKIFKDLIIYCDTNISSEFELLKQFIVKERFFYLIFKNFSYNLEFLIEESMYPSLQKLTLLYRLLGDYFGKLDGSENLDKSRNYYNKCINFLKKDTSNNLSSFFLEFAIKEEKANNEEKAIELYDYIINNFDRTNSTARFKLATYYCDKKNFKKGYNYLLSELKVNQENTPFFKNPDFLNKLSQLIAKLIKRSNISEALKMQKMAFSFGNYISKLGHTEIAKNLLTVLSNQFKHFGFVKGLIRHYIHHDAEKAREEIKKLKTLPKFPEVDRIVLTIEFLSKNENQKSAIQFGKDFVEENEENTEIDLHKIYYELGNIYVANHQFSKAKKWYNKLSPEWISTKSKYIRTILVTKDKNALEYSKRFFNKVPNSTHMYLISPYIELCISKGLIFDAKKFISQKFLNARAHRYDNKFISFLFQQQLKLTNDESNIERILNQALDIAIDDKQKSLVYFNFGDHLLEKSTSQQNKSDDETEEGQDYFRNMYYVQKAKNYFNRGNEILSKSIDFKQDDYIVFKEAYCLHLLGSYKEALELLNRIEDFNSFMLISSKIHNYIKLGNIDSAYKLYENAKSNTTKKRAAFILAQSEYFDQKKTTELYEESIQNERSYARNLHYAIYLFKVGNKNEYYSRQVLAKKKKDITKVPPNILRRYEREIERYKTPLAYGKYKLLEKIVLDGIKAKNINRGAMSKINKAIDKYQFDDRLYELKFKFLFAKKIFKECEDTLDWLIKLNFLTDRVIDMFYKLAKSYYNYYCLEREGIKPQEQLEKLTKALQYTEYILYYNKENINFNFLHCSILYKLGDYKRFEETSKSFTNNLEERSKKYFLRRISTEKRKIELFIWTERFSDYESKIQFYMIQERWAMILLNQKNVHDEVSLKILRSILKDKEFHLKNEHILEDMIKRRISSYYYLKKKNYKLALKYQMDIYKRIEFRENFVGAFLNTLFILEKYRMGKEKAEYYLKTNPTQYIYRKYGDFLKELKDYDGAYRAYSESIQIYDKPEVQAYSYRGILELYRRTIEMKVSFYPNKKVMNVKAKEVFTKIKELNPLYRKMDEALESFNFIIDWCNISSIEEE